MVNFRQGESVSFAFSDSERDINFPHNDTSQDSVFG